MVTRDVTSSRWMPSRRAVDMGAPAAVAALRTPPARFVSYSDFGPDCDRFANPKLELDHQNCVTPQRRTCSVAVSSLFQRYHLPGHLGEGAREGMEGEAHHMPPARADDGAKDHVGLENFSVAPVDVGSPPGLPDIVEKQDPARRRLDLDHHLGIGIAQQ